MLAFPSGAVVEGFRNLPHLRLRLAKSHAANHIRHVILAAIGPWAVDPAGPCFDLNDQKQDAAGTQFDDLGVIWKRRVVNRFPALRKANAQDIGFRARMIGIVRTPFRRRYQSPTSSARRPRSRFSSSFEDSMVHFLCSDSAPAKTKHSGPARRGRTSEERNAPRRAGSAAARCRSPRLGAPIPTHLAPVQDTSDHE
jgi:hypothetical protein